MDQETFDRIVAEGNRYIEDIRQRNRWENGVLQLPFVCYGCAEPRLDYFMTTGDGIPMCLRCFERTADTLKEPT